MKPKLAHPNEPAGVASDHHPAHAFSAMPGFKRILVPLDFSEGSLKALEYALSLAARFHARLILLHAVEPTVFPGSFQDLGATVDLANQNLLQSGRERLAELSEKRIGGRFPAELIVRVGHAHSEIPDTARAVGADLIVLGACSVPGQRQTPLGGTAERVLRHASCPVLTVPLPAG